MKDFRNERAGRPGVREEGMQAGSPSDLSSWRGRSGRRYVVGIRPPSELPAVADAVVLAVRREEDGLARIVASALAGEGARAEARAAWLSAAQAMGATELHVHSLARTEAERCAALADLRDADAEPDPGRERGGSGHPRTARPAAAARSARRGRSA